MVRVHGSDFQRHPWTRYALWGWRREIAAGAATILVLTTFRTLSPLAPVMLVGISALTIMSSSGLRSRIREQFQIANRERRLRAVFWWSDLVGRDGRLPIVRKESAFPAGACYLLQLPIGLHLKALEQRVGEIESTLNARAIRIRPSKSGARFVEMVVLARDPFATSVPSRLMAKANGGSVSVWETIEIGIDEEGRLARIGLPEHNLLIGGEPGAGKSVALTSIVATAALDATCELSIFDGKEVELLAWRNVAARQVGASLSDGIEALEEIREEMRVTYQAMVSRGQRKVTRGHNTGLRIVVIDELAWYLRGSDRRQCDRFAELLRDLVARGRAAGVVVIAATQKPSHEIVPTWIRDLFSYRLAMRCTSPEASDTILGQGWASAGFNGSLIDPSQRGVGYLLAEGGVPRLIRCALVDDDEIARLSSRAREIRRK